LPGKIAGAIIAGVAGAAQLAVAIATPIPKYRYGKGAGNNYEGMAIVGDGGKQEVIERADGSIEFTPDTDTLTHVGRNDIVHPDAGAWLSLINAAAQRDALKNMGAVGAKNSGIDIGAELEKQNRHLEKQNKFLQQIAGKRENHISAKDGALVSIWKYGANQAAYVDENTNWTKT